MKPKSIYLIRHGEIEKGKEKTFIGSTDLPLTYGGIQQAEALGRYFLEIKPEAIYCSSLVRSIQTAKILNKYCQISDPPVVLEALRELHMGAWEGKSFREIQETYPAEFAARGRDIINYRPPEGESFYDCYQRAMPVFQKIMETDEEKVIIVGHGGLNRLIICSLLRMPLSQLFAIEQEYACLNEILFRDQQVKLIKMNCHCGIKVSGLKSEGGKQDEFENLSTSD